MIVVPKDVAAGKFDAAAWRKRLLALNPWARGLTIDERNGEFTAARQKATLERHAGGMESWNVWAKGMLALKAMLEGVDQWAALSDRDWECGTAVGESEIKQVWLALAAAVFGTRFEDGDSFFQFLFPSDADFGRATFSGKAHFTGATFIGDAIFARATFSGNAQFTSATFIRDAGFSRATFIGDTDFTDATFSGLANFGSATFHRGGRFVGVSFSGNAQFESATFKGRTILERVRFDGDADFRHAVFEKPITFADSIVRQAANFEGIDNAAAFSLAGATFKQVPSFFGATFKGKLRLDNITTPHYPWLGYASDKDATARFRELRRHAAEAEDRERELEFFAQEIRTSRFHVKGLPSWVPKVWSWRFWFGLGFELLSDFGRSFWRPLLGWLALIVLCAMFYLGEHEDMRKARAMLAPNTFFNTLAAYAATTGHALADPPACRILGRAPFDSTDPVIEAIQLSLKNALVFNIGSTDSARRTFGCLYGPEDGVPARISMLSTVQALVSGLLIFLFALAVRNLLRLT